MENKKEIKNTNEELVAPSSKAKEAVALKEDIDRLDTSVKSSNRKLSCLFEHGVSSIGEGLAHLGIFPIGLFALTKVFCTLTNAGAEWIQINEFLMLRGNTILALYLSLPLAGMMFAFSVVSKNYHREYEEEKKELETRIEDDGRELETKKAQYQELSKTLSPEDEEFLRGYDERKAQRDYEIETLGFLRDKLRAHYEAGTLKEYFKQLGVKPEVIDAKVEEVTRIFTMHKKK